MQMIYWYYHHGKSRLYIKDVNKFLPFVYDDDNCVITYDKFDFNITETEELIYNYIMRKYFKNV